MRHPEQQPDEFFITNIDDDNYHNVGWKTKRKGDIAYDMNGLPISPISQLFPVFAKREEVRITHTATYEALLKEQYNDDTESLA